MPITETVLIKAAGSGLVRTLGFPLKESFNVTDISTLRLKQGATILAATFTVGSRWKGIPSDATKPIKWARVTFKDTGTPRDLTVDDAGGTVPAQSNPLVVANNANDIVISNGVISATFNKVADGQDLLTSVQIGVAEILHATDKPRLTIPVDKKTRTTYTSSQFDFAAIPTDVTIKVQNASLFTPGETVKFAWQGVVQDYFPTGGASGTPFLIMATPFGLPDMTIALMTNTHRINLILDYGAGNHVVPLNYSDSQGFCLLSAPPVTPTPGMLVRIQEVENEPTRTIQSVNAGANTITFTAALSNYLPQGVFLEPTTPASSTATMSLKASGTTIEKQYGDKAIIIKQEGVLKDGGQALEPNLTFILRHWFYADTGFVRTKITLRNSVETISTNPCPSIFFKALNFDVPTALAGTSVSDAVTDMTTSVARYKADNLHSSLNHSAIANFQWAVHEFNVQWPNAISVDATGCHFELFPASAGPIEFEGGITKSRDLFWGLNASNGLTLLDTIGATFDPAYIASSKAVRPNMVEKRNWNTVFASEPQKFRDACNHYERMMACAYDISVCEQVTPSRPAQTLKEYRWRLQEAGSGTYPFGWNKFGNTPDDVGFGNNRYDTPYILFREGLRESDPAKSALAWKLALQNIRNRIELGQMWNHQSQAVGTPDMYGLARYERAYAPNPFDYTNSPIANPTHSWNEGSCLYWALTDDPIAYEAAYAGVQQARQYNYQGTAGHRLYGIGFYVTKDPVTGNGNAEPRFAGWPIHTLVTGYRYFGEAIDLQRAQDYAQSFIATMAAEPQDDGFIHFKTGNGPTEIAALFQHGGYCMHGIIETWRESVGATQTALATYIGKVARFLQKGDQAAVSATANAPMLAGGTEHPNDPTKYNPLSSVAFTYQRSFADTLAVGINASDTNLQLNDASTFNLNLNSKVGVLMGSLTDPSTWEYFTYTGVSGNTLTGVVRNYKSTGAKSFAAGTVVYPSGMNATQNDVIVATLIMGARVTNDPTLQDFAQRMWEDNCLYRDRIDGGNLDFVTVGNYQPVNLWMLNVSTNSLKVYGQAGNAISEFLGDRLNPPSAPSITNLVPNAATAGAANFTLTVNGANFASDAEVRWNATTLTTNYVNAGQVTATVPSALVTTAGTATVTVRNVTEGLTSNGVTFTINIAGPGAPTITNIAPNTALVSVATSTITITGTNLGSASVTVDSNSVTPTSNSATQIVLPAQTFTSTGTKTIVVTTAGGSVNTSITVSNPAPSLSSIAPTNVTAGVGNTNITLTGSGFVASSSARAGATNLTTAFVSPTQLTAVIPSSLLAAAGTLSLTVQTAAPGGGTSAAQTFTINAAPPGAPTISNTSPSTATTNVATGAITITGTNLGSASVTMAGNAVTPTSNTATQIVLPTQTFTTPGSKALVVTTTGGTVNSSIMVTNPTPPPTPTSGGITLTGATNAVLGGYAGQPAVIATAAMGGANSTETIPAGKTGYVQVTLLSAKQNSYCGLSGILTGTDPNAIDVVLRFQDDYKIEVRQAGVAIYQTGAAPNQIQSWKIGDQFQFYVEQDRILLQRNWKTFFSVARPAGVAYRFACAFPDAGAVLGNPKLIVEGVQ